MALEMTVCIRSDLGAKLPNFQNPGVAAGPVGRARRGRSRLACGQGVQAKGGRLVGTAKEIAKPYASPGPARAASMGTSRRRRAGRYTCDQALWTVLVCHEEPQRGAASEEREDGH